MEVSDKRIDRGQSTRRGIIEAATRLFAGEGYEPTSIERVLTVTGVSRGALYHHFKGKEALFAAVFEAIEERILAAVTAAAQGAATPSEGLRRACRAWLRLAAGDAQVRQIVLIDAPVALGWKAVRELEAQYGLGLLRVGLARAGAGEGADADLAAHILLAALVEAGLSIARASDPAAAIAAAETAIDRLIAAFAPDAG